MIFILTVPIQTKHVENAEEEEDEDETYQPSSQSESETEESAQEEEEIDSERFIVSDDEEEISAEVKTVKHKKNLAQEAKDKKVSLSKRKAPSNPKTGGVKKAKQSVDVRKKVSVKPAGPQKKRTVRKKVKHVDENEIVEMEIETNDENKKKVENDKKTAKLVEFNDKNVDYNLYNEAPEHIKQMKVKLSSNILMFSRMIEASAGSTAQGLSYDYAALSFQRNTRTGKAYEFNLPLALAPTVIKGIQFLIKNNPKFFEKHLPIISKAKDCESNE
ncbi:hypothetical protein [Aeromonas sobria]|uniref:hypothetical protein n=1 Tax=Aeromonas sobria TaxID=646 RepID=UPI003F342033